MRKRSLCQAITPFISSEEQQKENKSCQIAFSTMSRCHLVTEMKKVVAPDYKTVYLIDECI